MTDQKKSVQRRRSVTVAPWLYLLPALLFIGVFTYYPFIANLIDSFFVVDDLGVRRGFAGFSNYALVLGDPSFRRAIGNTIIFALGTIPVSLAIGLVLALVAYDKRKLSPFYETMYSLPMAMSVSVLAMIFQLMLNPTLGIVNQVTGWQLNWLKNPATALPTLMVIEIWLNIGFNFLFLLTAIRGIPTKILDSAKIDGATGWTRITKIIIPCISPTILFLLVTSVAKEMITSGLTLILTQGGPDGRTETIVSYIYRQAILNQNYSLGYAASVLGFLVAFVFIAISFIYEKRGVTYS